MNIPQILIRSIPVYSRRVVRSIVKAVPSWTISSEKSAKRLAWIGKHISSPQNRLILGATALMSQPFIDGHNRRVDEETRKVSVARTVAKIIAGTTTGFAIRYLCVEAIKKMTDPYTLDTIKKPTWRNFLTPHRFMQDLAHYKFALGALLAIGVMVFTNFLIDAPLTKLLTNLFIQKGKEHEQKKLQNINHSMQTKQVKEAK